MTNTKATNSGNFAHNSARAKAAGSKGGKVSGGNFKNNPKRAAECGRRGGLRVVKKGKK